MSEKEVCPTCGSNSVTYNSQFIAEPLMMKCPACGGYHAGGCHKEAAGETRGELLKGRKGIEMEFIENSAKVLLERLEALGVIASIENRDWPEGKLADDGEIIVAISNHLKAFLREHWPDVQKLGS